ncbi:DUF2059 domain-containing protein [Viridibacterium curvum]|uniref:DUF2059 domain-containing protein n=1 Tax=Viridibacterium curvum TaxID=1101404 RepID=A0ABP9QT50_9RHOO
MKSVTTCLLLILGIMTTAVRAQTGIDPVKRATIQQLLQITGAENNVRAVMPIMARAVTQMIRTTQPGLPAAADSVIQKEVTAVFLENLIGPNGVLAQLEPVYDAAFTLEEMQQLLAFYNTPIGKKLLAQQPGISAQSTEIGQRWGQSLGPQLNARIAQALKREGLIK